MTGPDALRPPGARSPDAGRTPGARLPDALRPPGARPPVAGRTRAAVALAALALGAVALAAGFAVAPRRAALATLAAFAWVLGPALGALLVLAAGHVTGAPSLLAVRGRARAVASLLPALAVVFVAIVLARGALYPWAGAAAELAPAVRALLEHRRPFLNTPAFVVRAAAVFAVWIVLARELGRATPARRAGAGAVGLIAVLVTGTVAALDWLLALRVDGTSAAFGAAYLAGALAGGVALLLVGEVTATAVPGDPARAATCDALARLLVAASLVWGYLVAFEILVIWTADVPTEVGWLLARTGGGGWAVGAAAGLAGALVPAVLLVPRALRRRRGALVVAATAALAGRALDAYWAVLPARPGGGGARPGWIDLAAGVAAAAGLAFTLALAARAEAPARVARCSRQEQEPPP